MFAVLYLAVFFAARLLTLVPHVPCDSQTHQLIKYRKTNGQRSPWSPSEYSEFIKRVSNSTEVAVSPSVSVQPTDAVSLPSTPTIHPTRKPIAAPVNPSPPPSPPQPRTVLPVTIVNATASPVSNASSVSVSVSNSTKSTPRPAAAAAPVKPSPPPSTLQPQTVLPATIVNATASVSSMKPNPQPTSTSSDTKASSPSISAPSPSTPTTPSRPLSQPAKTTPHLTSTLYEKPSVDRNTSSWQSFIRHYQLYDNPTPTKLLFVVNFHFHHYRSIRFMESEFFPIFRRRFLVDFDVVFVGPYNGERRKVINNGLPPGGYYSYHSLSVAYEHLCVKEECSYFGFVLMNDDSYVDPVFLTGYDLTQSWVEPSIPIRRGERWGWIRQKNRLGKTNQEAFAAALEELKETEEGKKCHFEKAENQRRGFADFFYITQKDMKMFYPMMMVMKQHQVFLEMAAPTVNYCITHNFVVNCNHYKMEKRRTCVHMHPVKYSLKGMKEFALDRLYHKNLDRTPTRSW